MAATGSSHMPNSFALRSGLPTFGNFGNALLERSNPGLRKSTPDSEALASSDEEVEQSRLRSAVQRKAQPNRRSSLFAEQSQDSKRLSFVGNNTYSPATGSQPNTPGGTNDTWTTISPSLGAWNTGTAYPFGANIWGTKETSSSRLSEGHRQDNPERLNLSISSHPNPSVHRSLSFSVGQSDHEQTSSLASTMENSSRPNQYLMRRSSRQSNLASEASALGRVDEVGSSFMQPRMQSRTMSNTSTYNTSATFRTAGLRNSVHERPELAVDDVDEPVMQARVPIRNAPTRRLSDIQTITSSRGSITPSFSASNFLRGSRENLHWSSGQDLGHLETIPASRRHSFADVPTRRGSLGSTEDDIPDASYDTAADMSSQDQEASYFKPTDVARRVTRQVEEQLRQDHQQAMFGGSTLYSMAPTPSSIGSFHGPNPAPLYVVNFKCCRSEIFYIQEGTGLSVQEGDLVIVEADRGTDLGSVQHTHVSWEAARKYKTLYAEQHFQWLMMFSNQSRMGAPNLFNPNAVVPGKGGVNLPGHSSRDGDVKPKLIKRLAQAHEIQALQDKEGNEAKAKRVCQQKVQEHGLNMEILDAEFQMDGKKLTFYFFSTEYINFNSLVTDLFKLYKTRIWMSAINPASFQSPVSQLGLTPIYANTGLGVAGVPNTTNIYDDQRDDNRYFAQAPQQPAQQRAMPQLYYPGYGQAGQVAHVGAIGSGPLTGPVGQANGYGAFAPAYQQPRPTTDPFSGYNAPGYGVASSRPQSMGMSRPSAQPQNTQRSADNFANQLDSLSLAR